MKILHMAVLGAVLLVISPIILAGEVVVPKSATEAIKAESVSTLFAIRLDASQAGKQSQNIRTWATRSIDLKLAEKRSNPRLNRTTYRSILKSDILRYPSGRVQTVPLTQPQSRDLGTQGRLLQQQTGSGVTKPNISSVPAVKGIQVIYREGPGYFKFQKLKEVPARQAIEKTKAIDLAKRFIRENRLVKESAEDHVGRIIVEERRINEGRANGGSSRDYLVQQDIIIQRIFEGKPVINSKIVIGLQPDKRDIILLKHFNWQPVHTKQTREVTPWAPGISGRVSGASIQKRLVQKIQNEGGNFTRAEIKEVIPAWFQTESELIPVIAFAIGIEYPGGKTAFRRTYLEVLNLTGPDGLLYPDSSSKVPSPSKASP